jgi:iron-sulfur cluster repair protein YtfE (RIC family)
MMLIQQHNMKEEQMLYPMTDQALSDATAVLADMQALGDT